MISNLKEPQKASSLNDLVTALFNKNYTDAVDHAHCYTFSGDEFERYAFWNESHYTRNCIARNDDFELVLLCWEPGQKTANHCHNGQECWVKVISGEFEEQMFLLDENSGELRYQKTKTVARHEVTSVEAKSVFHTLQNIANTRAMSLHLYMKPIEHCRYVDSKTAEIKVVDLFYHSLEGKLL